MATPITPTPVLTGKDAKRFLKRMRDAETKPLTKKEIADYKRAKECYDSMTKNNKLLLDF